MGALVGAAYASGEFDRFCTDTAGMRRRDVLSFTDVGKGLVLGLCVASLGLMVDHLANRWAEGRRRALGL